MKRPSRVSLVWGAAGLAVIGLGVAATVSREVGVVLFAAGSLVGAWIGFSTLGK